MSNRGGRGGNTTGVRAVASVLGIARQDVASFTRLKKDPPPLYPPMGRPVLPMKEDAELISTVETKERLRNRFHLSHFYHEQRGPKEITRYTDKYRTQKPTDPFDPDFSRLPAELNWKEHLAKGKAAKIRKLNETSVEEKIARLEKNQEKLDKEDDVEVKKEDEAEVSDTEKPNQNEEAEELSDEDYLEEGNDYVDNYFDNGEDNSDDNLDNEAAY